MLAALIRAPTIEKAVKETGISGTTLRRWMSTDAEFEAAYNAAMEELLTDATSQAKKNLSTALDVLADVMQNGENAQVRVSAARATLEYSLKLIDACEIRERIADIENRLEAMTE